jgi:hypothetical protein
VRILNSVNVNRPVAGDVPGLCCWPYMQRCLAFVLPLEGDVVMLRWLWGREVEVLEGGDGVGLLAVLTDLR